MCKTTENTQQECIIHQYVTWDTSLKKKKENRKHFTGN